MTEVWYRPKGSCRTSGPPCQYDLWYREGIAGHPETTRSGRTTWEGSIPSYEFATMKELLASGICIRVAGVGLKTFFDEDYDVDEGL